MTRTLHKHFMRSCTGREQLHTLCIIRCICGYSCDCMPMFVLKYGVARILVGYDTQKDTSESLICSHGLTGILLIMLATLTLAQFERQTHCTAHIACPSYPFRSWKKGKKKSKQTFLKGTTILVAVGARPQLRVSVTGQECTKQ